MEKNEKSLHDSFFIGFFAGIFICFLLILGGFVMGSKIKSGNYSYYHYEHNEFADFKNSLAEYRS